MILVDHEIKRAIESGEIVIDPFDENNIGPTSYDVTLSPHFTVYTNQVFNLQSEPEYESLKIKENECITLIPPFYEALYDDSQELLFFRVKGQIDVPLDPEQVNLANIDGDYAIFTSVLASTNEYIKLPEHISAEYTGRSSLGRIYLQSHQTAGWIDAGFEGTITLELIALECPVVLYPYTKIGQIIFHRHNKCSVPYCKRKTSKYNKQVGAVPSRIYLDFRD